MTISPLQAAKLKSKDTPWSKLTEDEQELLLGNKRWRMNNLYFIRDKDGQKVLFQMNFAQSWLFKNLWFLTIILKARQIGFCLDPSTRVLTADLRWVAMEDLSPGEDIVAVDEHIPGGRGRGRKMRTAVVEGVVEVFREAYRITFDDGRSVVCTDKHPWLSKKTGTDCKWRSIKGNDLANRSGLKIGTNVRWVTKPWEGSPGYEDGWFGGMLDGEGSMALPHSSGAELNVCQVHGPVWDRLVNYCKNNGYNFRIEADNNPERESKFGKRAVPKLCISRMDEMFRLMGTTRPSRFMGRRFWEGKELPGKRNGGVGWAKITKIEHIGKQRLIDLQTSTGTYIAEGFVSHNTTFIDIYILDECLFNKGVEAGIIAHNKDDASKIFRRKIKFPYDNLPIEIKEAVRRTSNSKTEMEFSNGSIITVGVSFRSGTCQYLHLSEYGKICAKSPDKAEEIQTGALEAVAAGQMVFIESTAEGRGGDFYECCQRAKKLQDEGGTLTKMDYKLNFVPWWFDPEYVLPQPEQVLVTEEKKQYFEGLVRQHGIKLTDAQKAWYIKKEERLGEKMKREYPTTYEEAFEASIKGAYWGKLIETIRLNRQIGNVPHDPALQVHTAWDLGRRDTNVIWFFQHYGNQFRIINYYENSGEGLSHYVGYLRKLYEDEKYVYGKHYLPHDIAVTDLSSENNKSREQILLDLGMRNVIKVKREADLDAMQGVDAVRAILPMCWFDKGKCDDKGIPALEAYQKEWDEKHATFKNRPLHNWACVPKGTLIDTPAGPKAVEEFGPGDRVLIGGVTPRVIHAQSVGKQDIVSIQLPNRVIVRCSVGHKFFTSEGLVRADNLQPGMRLLTDTEIGQWSADSRGILSAFTDRFMESNTDSGRSAGYMPARSEASSKCSTGCYGSIGMDQSPRHPQSFQLKATGIIFQKITGCVDLTRRTAESLKQYITAKSSMALCSGEYQRQVITEVRPPVQPFTCNDMCGKNTWGQSQKDLLSTISTLIKRITTLKILGRTHLPTIPNCTLGSKGWSNGPLLVISTERQPSEMVYDIEVEHHHAYVLSESGAVTSNSHAGSAFKILAQGFAADFGYTQGDLQPEGEETF